MGLDGHTYNVNADHAAYALSCALQADELIFVTNVPGVLGQDQGECLPALTPSQVDALIAENTITGGMIPKVQSALAALERGVASVRITDLDGLTTEGGTCFFSH